MGKRLYLALTAAAALLFCGCGQSRFISADKDLESYYIGKSYYEIVAEFGRPDATMRDGMEGSKMAYNSVSLSGTSAADLYRNHTVRNRATKIEGAPKGGITFSLDANMKCYAVDSDFERERTAEAKPIAKREPEDKSVPYKIVPQIPRTIDYPYFDARSPFASNVNIEQVEVEISGTTVHFMYKDRTPEHRPLTNDGLFIMPEVYIEDCATGVRYPMTKCDGIALYPERSHFAQNKGGYDVLLYSITFEPLAESTEFINIIEPGHSGYNFYRVDVRTPMGSKDDLKEIE